jgi:hypothetical protein
MHMTKRTLIPGLFIFTLFFFVLATPVLARVMTPEERNTIKEQKRQELLVRKEERVAAMEQRREERSALIEERKEEKRTQLCERHAERIETKTNKFDNIKKGRLVAFENMLSRLNKFADRFEDRGYDVIELRARIEVLTLMVGDYSVLHETYIGALRGADYSCGYSEGAYARAVDQARGHLPDLRAKLVEISSYLKTEIRAELAELRSQIPDRGEAESSAPERIGGQEFQDQNDENNENNEENLIETEE